MDTPNLLTTYSGTSEQRIQAVFSQLFDTSTKSIEILSNTLLRDPSSIVRHEAAYILGEKNNQLAVDALVNAIVTDQAIIVIHESALALANLGELGYPRSKKILTDLLSNSNPDLVDTAEIALQRLQMKINKSDLTFEKQALINIMKDKSPLNKEKRIQASFLLMVDASSESVDILIESLNTEPSSIVKHEMIFSLGESIHYKVVPVLMDVLKNDKNFFTIHESLLALGTIGDKGSEEILRKFLKHENPEIVESAEIGLERLFS